MKKPNCSFSGAIGLLRVSLGLVRWTVPGFCWTLGRVCWTTLGFRWTLRRVCWKPPCLLDSFPSWLEALRSWLDSCRSLLETSLYILNTFTHNLPKKTFEVSLLPRLVQLRTKKEEAIITLSDHVY